MNSFFLRSNKVFLQTAFVSACLIVKKETDCDGNNNHTNISKSPDWAYPSPYDAAIDKQRFLDISHSKYKKSDQWNLVELVKLWEDTDGEGGNMHIYTHLYIM